MCQSRDSVARETVSPPSEGRLINVRLAPCLHAYCSVHRLAAATILTRGLENLIPQSLQFCAHSMLKSKKNSLKKQATLDICPDWELNSVEPELGSPGRKMGCLFYPLGWGYPWTLQCNCNNCEKSPKGLYARLRGSPTNYTI